MSFAFGDLNDLFYDDFQGYGMPAIWNTKDYSVPRRIEWSTTDSELLFKGELVPVDGRIELFNDQIAHAFYLWDEALESIYFVETDQGNNADITFATSSDTGNNFAVFIRKIPASTGYIEAGRVKLNADKLLDQSPDLQSKIIIHEIGNILGLGDIICSDNIQSVQEDKCSPKEPFMGGNSLYAFDTELIKYLYGEPFFSSPEARPRDINGTPKKDKLIGTNGDDNISGDGGADKIDGKKGDDLIDPGLWTSGKFDVIKGGKGRDTFVIKKGYWAFIKDFKVLDDRLDITGLSSNFDWEIKKGKTYIYDSDGFETLRLKGKIDLSKAETI